MEKTDFKRIVVVALFLILSFSLPMPSFAAYPEKVINFICPWAAGTTPDLVSRNIANVAKKYFPKPMVVVFKPGGVGAIGVTEVLQSKPDGYTIGLSGMMLMALQPHRAKLPWASPDDYTTISRLIDLPTCLVVRKSAPWNNLREFIEYAKANPGKIRIEASGRGNIFSINAELLKMKTGVDIQIIPNSGITLTATLGGHVDGAVVFPGMVVPHSEKLKILCVFEEKRDSFVPDVPTAKESGFDFPGVVAYYMIFGPKGLPNGVVSTLDAGLKKIMVDPDFTNAMKKNYLDTTYEGPDAAKKRLSDDYKNNAKLVEILNLKEQ